MVSTVERARPRGTPKPSAAAPTVLPPASATYCSSARSWSPIDLFTSSSMVSVPTPGRRLLMTADYICRHQDTTDDMSSQEAPLSTSSRSRSFPPHQPRRPRASAPERVLLAPAPAVGRLAKIHHGGAAERAAAQAVELIGAELAGGDRRPGVVQVPAVYPQLPAGEAVAHARRPGGVGGHERGVLAVEEAAAGEVEGGPAGQTRARVIEQAERTHLARRKRQPVAGQRLEHAVVVEHQEVGEPGVVIAPHPLQPQLAGEPHLGFELHSLEAVVAAVDQHRVAGGGVELADHQVLELHLEEADLPVEAVAQLAPLEPQLIGPRGLRLQDDAVHVG